MPYNTSDDVTHPGDKIPPAPPLGQISGACFFKPRARGGTHNQNGGFGNIPTRYSHQGPHIARRLNLPRSRASKLPAVTVPKERNDGRRVFLFDRPIEKNPGGNQHHRAQVDDRATCIPLREFLATALPSYTIHRFSEGRSVPWC